MFWVLAEAALHARLSFTWCLYVEGQETGSPGPGARRGAESKKWGGNLTWAFLPAVRHTWGSSWGQPLFALWFDSPCWGEGTVNWSDLLRHISYGPRFQSPSCLWLREKSSLESVNCCFCCLTSRTLFTCLLSGHFMFYFLCVAFCCTLTEGELMGGVSWMCVFCHVWSHISLLWIGHFTVQTVWICFTHELPTYFVTIPFLCITLHLHLWSCRFTLYRLLYVLIYNGLFDICSTVTTFSFHPSL